MSVYLNKNKGWRYDFILNGTRHTKAWFKTKKEAMIAEAKRREEIKHPITVTVNQTPTDMDFLTLVNKRLDHIKVYQSEKHYKESIYYAKRWVKRWHNLTCSEISQDMIEKFI
ncbi:MAG TPA: site-specific integrase, partial [Candidatus Nanoarchaeia archaeon]|nr:site-specific integrase [Candidatus Nanoarchaeia archaeon]